MAYRFRLDRVLHYYRGREDEARDELERRRGQLAVEQKKSQQLRDEQLGVARELAAQATSADLRLLGVGYDYFYLTMQRLEHQEVREKEAGRQVNRQRGKLKVRWRDRRSLEILKEQGVREFKRALDKLEEKEQDELTLLRFKRSR